MNETKTVFLLIGVLSAGFLLLFLSRFVGDQPQADHALMPASQPYARENCEDAAGRQSTRHDHAAQSSGDTETRKARPCVASTQEKPAK